MSGRAPRVGPLALAFSLALLVPGCSEEACTPPQTDTLGELRPWEQAYVAGEGTPASPAPDFLDAEDGLALAYHSWAPPAWPEDGAVVLIVPGSSAYAELYAALGEGLHDAGVRARIIDVRGHGRSTCDAAGSCADPPSGGYATSDDGEYYRGRPGDSLDANQIIRDLGRHVADLRKRYPEARVILAGHSSGGGVVSRFVEHGGLASVDSVALIAPFHSPEQPQNLDEGARLCPGQAGSAYAQLDLGALGAALRGDTHRYVLDLVKAPEYQAPLDVRRYSYTTMLGMATLDADSFFPAYDRPTLWIAGEHDAVLDLERSRAQFERLPGGGAFVEVLDTSHIGLSWSAGVAELLARWATSPELVLSGEIDP